MALPVTGSHTRTIPEPSEGREGVILCHSSVNGELTVSHSLSLPLGPKTVCRWGPSCGAGSPGSLAELLPTPQMHPSLSEPTAQWMPRSVLFCHGNKMYTCFLAGIKTYEVSLLSLEKSFQISSSSFTHEGNINFPTLLASSLKTEYLPHEKGPVCYRTLRTHHSLLQVSATKRNDKPIGSDGKTRAQDIQWRVQ